MENEKLAFHETMETHEIKNFKTICCFDNDLKALMEKDVQQSIVAINGLKTFYDGARTNF
ncbi:spore coat protein [Peribacillus simplex]|uniref:spore coat protein n=1 Tax=Peribacillus simplex TaxID=1478 RepID=UPI003334C69B